MEVALAVGTLKVAYHLLIVGIKVDQVPNAVRRCIELVRTCHRDLEDLIKLRNESLPMLESKPAILQRINSIIANAHNGLLEVARLVEKLRPEAHDGTSPFMGRLEWIFVDSREFSSQEPLISRQHSSVIAELNFLRQLILLTPLLEGSGSANDKPGTEKAQTKRPAIAWDNVGLLDEMLGGRKQNIPQVTPTPGPAPTSPPSTTTTDQTAPVGRVSSPTPTISDPPPPYSSPKPAQAFPVPVPSAPTSHTNPLVYNVAVPVQGVSVGGSGSNLYTGHVKASTEKRRTTFDAEGISFLFGDLKIGPKPAATSTATSMLTTQPSTSTPLATGTAASYPWEIAVATRSTTHANLVQGPIGHQPSSTPNEYPQAPDLPAASESYQVSQHPPKQTTHPTTHAQHQSQAQQQTQQQSHTPKIPLYPQPHSHPPPQGPPVPAEDEPLYEIKPLSTIPQELIHRHDGVKSPPLQPLFSPLLGDTALAIRPSPSVPTGAVHLKQVQALAEQRHQPSVPSNKAQGNPECCSSCGSARNSLFNVPTGVTSRPSSLNMAESSHSSYHNPAEHQPIYQHQHNDRTGHIRTASIDQPRTEDVHIPQSDLSSYPPAQSEHWAQPNPAPTAALRFRPSTADLQYHSFPSTGYFAHSRQPSNPDPSGRHPTSQPPQPPATMSIAPSLAPQLRSSIQDTWTQSYSTQHQQTSHPYPTQSRVPSSGSDQAPRGSGHSNPHPTFQTFATTREHWKPETLTGTGFGFQQQVPVNSAPLAHLRLDAPGYPDQPDPTGQPTMNPQEQEYHHPVRAYESGTYNVTDTDTQALAVSETVEAEAAELYGSSALAPGLEQHHDKGRWYVKTYDGTVHTEIHELPSVKFAPDPIELE